MSVETPTDYELRASMKALIEAADAAALVYPDWLIELVEGRSLNTARKESGKVQGAMMTRRHDARERVGDVPYQPSKVAGTKFTVATARVYEFRFFFGYSDEQEGGKSTEQLFNEWLDAVVLKFAQSPKLGANERVEHHGELQISNRRIPAYGNEYAHTADGLLTVHMHETVTAS
jgi:hypothetical protein